MSLSWKTTSVVLLVSAAAFRCAQKAAIDTFFLAIPKEVGKNPKYSACEAFSAGREVPNERRQ